MGVLSGNNNDSKGLLLQVSTGSGKSGIIAITAITASLLFNKHVDIYTSSSVLAERDAANWNKLYKLFELECDHNSDKGSTYLSGEKDCYKKEIIYGDCSQFQFDYLRHAYSDLGTRGEREFKNSIAIIDEVDAMFIDDSTKLARLSSTLPGMDLIQLLYFTIWDRLTHIKSRLYQVNGEIYYLEGRLVTTTVPTSYYVTESGSPDMNILKVSDVSKFIMDSTAQELEAMKIHAVNDNDVKIFVQQHLVQRVTTLISPSKDSSQFQMKVPAHLLPFVKLQVPKWVDSALTALSYQENIHYMVHNGKIKPVGYNTTGIVHDNTNWNNGLHQFLQLKHGLRMESESVTTNFLSNYALLELYGKGAFIGLTGTLGSESGKRHLQTVYNVETMLMPDTHYKHFLRFPDILAYNENEWLGEIIRSTVAETAKKRGVLIICETIKSAQLIGQVLSQLKSVHVKLYVKNAENQEKQIARIHPGDVIVATNLAGRGTDIQTVEIEKYGGLHVCLTFLPGSLRVEEQAFGRTARQGNRGTGQLIIISSHNEADNNVIHESSVAKDVLAVRDQIEQQLLEQFEQEQLPVIKLKDELFATFLCTLTAILGKLKEERSFLKKIFAGKPTKYEMTCIEAVEERWAIFLRDIDERVDDLGHANAIKKRFTEFIAKLNKDARIGSMCFLRSSQNPYYFIQLGNYEFRSDWKLSKSLPEAVKYYDEAIKINSTLSTGAYVGKAYALFKGTVNTIFPDTHEQGYKEIGLKYLTKAQSQLHEELALLRVQQILLEKNHPNALQLPLGQQLLQRTNLIGTYLKNIENAKDIVNKSLRLMHFTTTVENTSRVKLIPDSVVKKTASRELKSADNFDKYHLTFHHQTVRQDSGITIDQMVNTISWSFADKFDAFKTNMKNLFGKSVWTDSLQREFPITLSCYQQPDFDKLIPALENVNQVQIYLTMDVNHETGKVLVFYNVCMRTADSKYHLILPLLSYQINELSRRMLQLHSPFTKPFPPKQVLAKSHIIGVTCLRKLSIDFRDKKDGKLKVGPRAKILPYFRFRNRWITLRN